MHAALLAEVCEKRWHAPTYPNGATALNGRQRAVRLPFPACLPPLDHPLPPGVPVTTLAPTLAHIGSPNNPWIGVMTVSAWVLLVVFALVVADRIELEAPGDLLLPLAAVVLVAGLTGSLGDVINDQGPWAVPAGLVVLIALLWAAFGDLDLTWGARSTYLVIGAAVVAAVALYAPLEGLWFPTGEDDQPLPALEDAEVAAEVVEPLDEDGTVVVRVTLDSATFGDNTGGERPTDPETGLTPRFQVGPVYLTPPVPEECVEQEACTQADFELTLPSGFVTDPPESLVVELLTADRKPFAPPLQTRFDLTTSTEQ